MPEVRNHKITVTIEFDIQGVNPIGSVMDHVVGRIEAIPGGNIPDPARPGDLGSKISSPVIVHAEFRRT
jgi:hypothetical protein